MYLHDFLSVTGKRIRFFCPRRFLYVICLCASSFFGLLHAISNKEKNEVFKNECFQYF